VQYGPRAAAIGVYLLHGQFLSQDRACAALADLFGCAPSPGALASMARKAAAAAAPALAAAPVAHFDETGFRVADGLAWVHSASSGKYVLVTVHGKRGKTAWTPPGCCRSSAVSPAMTPGRPMTATRTWPGTLFAMPTCFAS